jgi:hypothetical protein
VSNGSLRVILATAIRDAAGTSATSLKVTFLPHPSDGSSPVTSYEVQMDDGVSGGFYTVAGRKEVLTYASTSLLN